jgi:hypothetical protein
VNLRLIVPMCIALLASGAQAQSPLERVSGDVVALDNATLQVKTAKGQTVPVKLAANARVTVRAPTDIAGIAPGMYVATTAVPQPDGTLLASEIRIFPESQRGTGEGHRPMDTPGNTMTNATVSKVSAPANTMTNATVATVAGGGGSRKMTLTYKDGEKVVVVPEGIPIVQSEVGDRALLVAGAHVVVYASRQPDGSLSSERVSVGKGNYVPPS